MGRKEKITQEWNDCMTAKNKLNDKLMRVQLSDSCLDCDYMNDDESDLCDYCSDDLKLRNETMSFILMRRLICARMEERGDVHIEIPF